MAHQIENVIPREAMQETKDLFNVADKISPEKLHDFTQFMRGVHFGLDLADNQPVAPRPGG